MLCNSTRLKIRLIKNLEENIRIQAQEKSPLVGAINKSFVFEGDRLGVKRQDNSISIDPLSPIEATAEVKKEDVTSETMKEVTENLSNQIADAQSRIMIDTLNKVTEESGNKVNGGGRPPSPELILEALKVVLIDFENDIPRLPTVVCHPDALEKMAQAYDELMHKEPHKSKFEALIEEKRKDFNEREACRKLVD